MECILKKSLVMAASPKYDYGITKIQLNLPEVQAKWRLFLHSFPEQCHQLPFLQLLCLPLNEQQQDQQDPQKRAGPIQVLRTGKLWTQLMPLGWRHMARTKCYNWNHLKVRRLPALSKSCPRNKDFLLVPIPWEPKEKPQLRNWKVLQLSLNTVEWQYLPIEIMSTVAFILQ